MCICRRGGGGGGAQESVALGVSARLVRTVFGPERPSGGGYGGVLAQRAHSAQQ